MKTKILMFVVLMGFAAVLAAQPTDRRLGKSFHGQNAEMRMNDEHGGLISELNLTDAQKEALKQSRIDLQKQLKPLRNELGEAEAHQKTLMTAEKPDLNAIDKNIEKIGMLKTEMAKVQVKHRLDMRAQLTDEQKLKFDMFRGKMNRPMMKHDHSLN